MKSLNISCASVIEQCPFCHCMLTVADGFFSEAGVPSHPGMLAYTIPQSLKLMCSVHRTNHPPPQMLSLAIML
eukprot:6399158-Karenia_brevis.AAC.1